MNPAPSSVQHGQWDRVWLVTQCALYVLGVQCFSAPVAGRPVGTCRPPSRSLRCPPAQSPLPAHPCTSKPGSVLLEGVKAPTAAASAFMMWTHAGAMLIGYAPHCSRTLLALHTCRTRPSWARSRSSAQTQLRQPHPRRHFLAAAGKGWRERRLFGLVLGRSLSARASAA